MKRNHWMNCFKLLWLLYGAAKSNIRRRDLHKLGLDRYRVIPDTRGIENFLLELYNVYEHDLKLPVEEVDNSWIDEYFV